MVETRVNQAMVKESLMQDPFLGVTIWMQLVQHVSQPIMSLFLWVTLKSARLTEQHLISFIVDLSIRVALIIERATEQQDVKPLMLESILNVALNLQQIPLPDLSLGVGLRTGKVVYQQLRSSSPGPTLTLV